MPQYWDIDMANMMRSRTNEQMKEMAEEHLSEPRYDGNELNKNGSQVQFKFANKVANKKKKLKRNVDV